MIEPAKEGPSTRALKQLNNRNNLAELKLRKTLEQFRREQTFSINCLDRDKLDTKDFLKAVKYCDSDYLPQARAFLGSPSTRRHRSHTARTAPGRMRTSMDQDLLDSDDESECSGGLAPGIGYVGGTARSDVGTVPVMRGARLLASRKMASRPNAIDEYQRAERFLRQLREEVAREELQSHYTDPDYQDFVNAVITNMQRPVTPTINTPSNVSIVDRPVSSKQPPKPPTSAGRMDDGVRKFSMVYPIKLLGNITTKNEPRTPTPSPSLGSGSPRVRCTPMGLPEGGALGTGARLVMTAPQPLKPWPGGFNAMGGGVSVFPSINGVARSDIGGLRRWEDTDFRSVLKSRYHKKPLDERVKDFCKELDDIRSKRVQLLSQSAEKT